MIFAQQNHLLTFFSDYFPVIKWYMTAYICAYYCIVWASFHILTLCHIQLSLLPVLFCFSSNFLSAFSSSILCGYSRTVLSKIPKLSKLQNFENSYFTCLFLETVLAELLNVYGFSTKVMGKSLLFQIFPETSNKYIQIFYWVTVEESTINYLCSEYFSLKWVVSTGNYL